MVFQAHSESDTGVFQSFNHHRGFDKADANRMAISPDGKVIYLPSLEKAYWHVVDAGSGEVIRKIVTNSGAHNTRSGLATRSSCLNLRE
ncbi:MAG: hypothetical protein DME22_03615 [Verrucomicrobia bacterium]|nr:MAG: hypothetical protein DME22_03615 [Verrucomicrobiota bacterium]